MTLEQLINREEAAWPMVQRWIAEASNLCEALPPPDDTTREQALLATQVTTRSPMGAIIYETGGILIDHGWLRILGSGHARLPRTLPGWNWGRSAGPAEGPPPFLLVADDAVGGFFAVDGGGLNLDKGKVCHHPPDTLSWESMELSYCEFLDWCLNGNLTQYYECFRWPAWKADVLTLPGNRMFCFYPFLSCEGPPLEQRSRREIPVDEVYSFNVGTNK